MAHPKHKPKEIKKKTIFDRLKQSALFVLFIILVIIVDAVAFIFWLSGLLKGSLAGKDLITDGSFVTFAGLATILAVFFAIAWFVQRRAHGPRRA